MTSESKGLLQKQKATEREGEEQTTYLDGQLSMIYIAVQKAGKQALEAHETLPLFRAIT